MGKCDQKLLLLKRFALFHIRHGIQDLFQYRALFDKRLLICYGNISRRVLIESSYALYRNPYFLVKKKEGNKYRLINNAVKINRVIIKDGNLPPAINEFSEEFNNYTITLFIDFFSDYDQVELDERSRNLTSFHTPIRFYRITTFP